MADPKKSYNDIITWAKGASNDIIAKKLATPRSISITNNAGTSLASGKFDGSADVTIKLPATVAIDISGNANSASGLKSTTTTGPGWQPVIGIVSGTTSGSASTVYRGVGENIAFCDQANSALAYSCLKLGNNTAKTSSSSSARAGKLVLYGTGAACLNICMGSTSTNDRTITINSNLTADTTYTLPTSSGTLALVSDISSMASSVVAVPIGTVLPYLGYSGSSANYLPSGFVACDGSHYSKTTYSTLYTILKSIGLGADYTDDTTQFVLPDLREAYLKGCVLGYKASGISAAFYNNTIGHVLNERLPDISGSFTSFDRQKKKTYTGGFSVNDSNRWSANVAGGGDDSWGTVVDFAASKSNSVYGYTPPANTELGGGGQTVIPYSVIVNWIIRII